jgi:hypothetical protein
MPQLQETGSSASAIGIAMTSTTAGQTVSQNTIHSITVNPATASTAIQINGIYYAGPSTGIQCHCKKPGT